MNSRRRRAGGVRTLTPSDVERVAELHLASFDGERRLEDIESFLDNVLFRNPWMDDRFPPLGCEDADGRLVGCLGVMPRPMLLHGAPVTALVTHNFMVDTESGRSLAAIELMREVHRQRPDAFLAEANEQGRAISERLGFRVVASRSRRWLRLLRPCALGVRGVTGRLPAAVARLGKGLACLGDLLIQRMPRSPWRPPSLDKGTTRHLDASVLARLVERATVGAALRPVYTVKSLEWLIATLRSTRRTQYVRARVVLDGDDPLGWFIYYSRPEGVGRVIQLGSWPGQHGHVLAHLLADAEADGNAAVSGASDPAWNSELEALSCFFRDRKTWLMASSGLPEFQPLLESPHAFFGRLEGEGWMRFAF